MLIAGVALFGGWFALGIAGLVYMIQLKKYRTDITQRDSFTAGRHWAWEPNVLSPANYTPEGRKKLPILYGLIAVQVILGVALLIMLVS